METSFRIISLRRKTISIWLLPSKLRTCSIGPELVLGSDFARAEGTVLIERDGKTLWQHEIATGEAHTVHSLANLEHHHFKFPTHRQPGDVHVHFFGTGAFSFGAGIQLEAGDVMIVDISGYGKPLRNPLKIDDSPQTLMEILPL